MKSYQTVCKGLLTDGSKVHLEVSPPWQRHVKATKFVAEALTMRVNERRLRLLSSVRVSTSGFKASGAISALIAELVSICFWKIAVVAESELAENLLLSFSSDIVSEQGSVGFTALPDDSEFPIEIGLFNQWTVTLSEVYDVIDLKRGIQLELIAEKNGAAQIRFQIHMLEMETGSAHEGRGMGGSSSRSIATASGIEAVVYFFKEVGVAL